MEFCNLFKMIDPYADDTPPFHYAMLDKFNEPENMHANLCHRGAAKTTLMGIRLLLWLAITGGLPGNDDINNAIYVSDSLDNGVKTLRKNLQSLYDRSALLRQMLPTFNLTENYLSCVNARGQQFDAKFFGVQTGIRGTQINNRRPYVAIIDDVMSDKNAASNAYRKLVNEIIYAGVLPAMNPSWNRIILLGTPFDYDDVIVRAVSSNAWNCSVFPVAEKFPCEPEEFRSSWPSRFTFEAINKSYKALKDTGNIPYFQREYMLRLGSPDAVMVPLEEMEFFDIQDVVNDQCNFIITTDFAYTDKETADASVISVWAISPHGNILWVDGSLKKETMDRSMDRLIDYCHQYNPIQVGIEVTGQQSAVVSWFKAKMNEIGMWWPIASNQKNHEPGIRPTQAKLSRFAEVAPWLRSGKIRFPDTWEDYAVLREGIKQIVSTTAQGIVTADDFLDTVSMVTQIPFWSKNDPMDVAHKDQQVLVDVQDDVYTAPTYNHELPKTTNMRSYLV